jgi:ectoine hydroxylase-related dioxygenase (phytanoyl-CoA dioxygenase family)
MFFWYNAGMVTEEQRAFYRENGFVHIPNVLSRDEAERFRQVALDYTAAHPPLSNRPVFDQHVNCWTDDDRMKQLTLHPNVAKVASALVGVPLRLWHDQILIKQPHNNAPTEFHQDLPYWPHSGTITPISAWIALCDVPVERGCMTFLPGSHRITDLPAQNLGDPRSLFQLAPDLVWSPRLTVPLKAGDCTFHHGLCAHMATPNFTDEPRVAHVVIFMGRNTTYSGKGHVVTDPLGLPVGATLQGDQFPDVG